MAKNFEKTSFTAADLCKIIKVCSDTNISVLSVGDIKIEFFNRDQVEKTIFPSVETKPQGQQEANPELEQIVKELEDENLLLLDPFAYEQKRAEGELDDGRVS